MDIVEMHGYGATVWAGVIYSDRETLARDFEQATGLTVTEIVEVTPTYAEVLASR